MGKPKTYAISLVRMSKRGGAGRYRISKTRYVKAKNYIQASKKLKVKPYAMRTYGIIVKKK
jgi:transcriptional regulator CtsR